MAVLGQKKAALRAGHARGNSKLKEHARQKKATLRAVFKRERKKGPRHERGEFPKVRALKETANQTKTPSLCCGPEHDPNPGVLGQKADFFLDFLFGRAATKKISPTTLDKIVKM